LGGGDGGFEDVIGGEEREMRVATERETGELAKDEGRIGVGGVTGLDGLEVEEFTGFRNGIGGEKRGGGEASGD
jgi:hypothetical protein